MIFYFQMYVFSGVSKKKLASKIYFLQVFFIYFFENDYLSVNLLQSEHIP